MCGILGFSGNKQLAKLEQLLELIEHRGRDERDIDYVGQVNLGMNRLAIIDIKPQLYPMKYKHYTMVYNGEIYNYLDLRKSLQRKGIEFKTNSDAEVILPLFDQVGVQAFAKLEGMFAIAIVDTKKGEVILARDKAGEKPIYYAQTGKGMIFGSELKVLLKSNWLQNKLNLKTLGDYLHHGSIASKETLIRDVEKVLPAQCVIFDLKKQVFKAEMYWHPQVEHLSDLVTISDRREKLDILVNKAVVSRMLADVPVGAFLSGGVDSSLVTALAMRQSSRLKTFSISFPESRWYDESRYSQKVANFLGTDHTQVDCTAKTARSIMERMGELIDEPICDPAVLPTYLLSQMARKSVSVVLTGEGADELFGGYYRYQKYWYKLQINRSLRQIPGLYSLRQTYFPKRLKRIFEATQEDYSALNVWSEAELDRLLNHKIQVNVKAKMALNRAFKDELRAMQTEDFTGYLASQLLFKVDKFTMLNNLEARAPFLSTDLINFGLSLDADDKIHLFQGKYLLKKVAEKYLPKEIVWRVKRGFSLPLGAWFRGEYLDLVEKGVEIIKGFDEVFDAQYYQSIVSAHMAKGGENDYRDKIWSMTVLAFWMEHYRVTL